MSPLSLTLLLSLSRASQVNSGPALCRHGKVLETMIPRLIEEVFQKAIDPTFPPPEGATPPETLDRFEQVELPPPPSLVAASRRQAAPPPSRLANVLAAAKGLAAARAAAASAAAAAAEANGTTTSNGEPNEACSNTLPPIDTPRPSSSSPSDAPSDVPAARSRPPSAAPAARSRPPSAALAALRAGERRARLRPGEVQALRPGELQALERQALDSNLWQGGAALIAGPRPQAPQGGSRLQQGLAGKASQAILPPSSHHASPVQNARFMPAAARLQRLREAQRREQAVRFEQAEREASQAEDAPSPAR